MDLARFVAVFVAEPVASREDLVALLGLLRDQNAALIERCADLEEQNAALAAANERCTRRQVTGIPVVTVDVTEHRLHTVRCSCGHATTASAPERDAASSVSYRRLRALAVYLFVFQHVSVEWAAGLITDVTGARVSTGWVGGVLSEAAALVADALDLIRALLVLGHLRHTDETTIHIGAKRRCLHVACTEKLTLLGLAPRSREGVDSLQALPALRGTLVHDSLFFYVDYPRADHQLCGAHLVRELTAAEKDHPQDRWHQQVRWVRVGLNKQAIRVRIGKITEIAPDVLLFYLAHYHRGVALDLVLHPHAPRQRQSPTRNLLERLRDQAHAVPRFADDPLHVPFTTTPGSRRSDR